MDGAVSIQITAQLKCDGRDCPRQSGIIVELKQGNDEPDSWQPQMPEGWLAYTPYFQGEGTHGRTEHLCSDCLEKPSHRR